MVGTGEPGAVATWTRPAPDTRGQIKQQKWQVAHLVFHVVAEDPQKQHIARQMHPAAVQKYRCHKGFIRKTIHDPCRYDSVFIIQLTYLLIVTHDPHITEEDQDIGSHQQVNDIGRAP